MMNRCDLGECNVRLLLHFTFSRLTMQLLDRRGRGQLRVRDRRGSQYTGHDTFAVRIRYAELGAWPFDAELKYTRPGPSCMGASIRSLRTQTRRPHALLHSRHLLLWHRSRQRRPDHNAHPVLHGLLRRRPGYKHWRCPQ